MNRLGDDLVFHVVGFLGDAADRARAAAACRRFRELSRRRAWWGPTALVVLATDAATRSFADFAGARAGIWEPRSLKLDFFHDGCADEPLPVPWPAAGPWPVGDCLGSLPRSLRKLTVYTAFDTTGFGALAALTQLRSLSIYVLGDHAGADLGFLASLENLEHLMLTPLVDFLDAAWSSPAFPFPPGLRELDLGVRITSVPELCAGLRPLRQLEGLSLGDADLTQDAYEAIADEFTDVLCGLTELTRLECGVMYRHLPRHVVLFRPRGEFAAHLPAPGVYLMDLSGFPTNFDADHMAPLAESFPALRGLLMSDTPLEGDEEREVDLASLPPGLTGLALDGCSLEGVPSLSYLADLRSLNLSRNPTLFAEACDGEAEDFVRAALGILHPAVEELARLTGLERLDLTDTGILPLDLAALSERLPVCDIITQGPSEDDPSDEDS